MSQQGPVPCPYCGTAVELLYGATAGVCPGCQAQVPAPGASAHGAPIVIPPQPALGAASPVPAPVAAAPALAGGQAPPGPGAAPPGQGPGAAQPDAIPIGPMEGGGVPAADSIAPLGAPDQESAPADPAAMKELFGTNTPTPGPTPAGPPMASPPPAAAPDMPPAASPAGAAGPSRPPDGLASASRPPGPGAMPGVSPGFPIARVAAGAVVVILISALGTAGWYFLAGSGGVGSRKGKSPYSALGIVEPSKANPDELIGAVEKLATGWREDAVWWSITLPEVHADGTVDLTKAGAEVVFVSPRRVEAKAKATRKDSIKKFQFGPDGVDFREQWGAKDPWAGLAPPARPECSIESLLDKLESRGIEGGKTVSISFDPQWASAAETGEQSWRVESDKPKFTAWYSMKDCKLTMEQ